MSHDLRARLEQTGTQLAALAERLRRLITLAVTSEAPAERLDAATRALDDAIAVLAPYEPAGPTPRFPAADRSRPEQVMPFDPVLGPLNPLAPPLRFAWDPPRAIATATFDTPYEGPPGCVHGGIIACAFDQVLSVANLLSGRPGPTVRLALRFRRPTPIRMPLRFEGWQEHTDDRRVHTVGRLLAGDRVTVEAEGSFALLSTDAVMRLGRRD
jgi:acyl-coenzyme A thioesterase PaaI-like protein